MSQNVSKLARKIFDILLKPPFNLWKSSEMSGNICIAVGKRSVNLQNFQNKISEDASILNCKNCMVEVSG